MKSVDPHVVINGIAWLSYGSQLSRLVNEDVLKQVYRVVDNTVLEVHAEVWTPLSGAETHEDD